MNETLQTIQSRYSCRSFTGESLKKEEVEAIAMAALQSPSGMNMQPWQIVVVQDKDFLDDMDVTTMEMLAKQQDQTVYNRIMSRGGKLYYNTPCMFMIAKKPGTDLDCGIVAENIALAASSLGLGNVICGLARLSFQTEKGETYREKLIPEGYEFGVAVLVGYPINADGKPHEVDLSKITYIG